MLNADHGLPQGKEEAQESNQREILNEENSLVVDLSAFVNQLTPVLRVFLPLSTVKFVGELVDFSLLFLAEYKVVDSQVGQVI